jgi:D-alanine-D-alanine ligase
MKKNIAVAMGGYSSEFEVSMGSGQVVFDNLDANTYNLYKVHITKEKWVAIADDQEFPIDKNDFSFTGNAGKVTFDAVFNVIHGNPGEDGPFAGYLSMLAIPQTSSDYFESALTFNKAECSMLLKGFGVNIAEAFYLAKHEDYDVQEIVNHVGLPCFVKPNRSGSSIGISKVKSLDDMEEAIEKAFDIDSQIIIEAMVEGTEVGCGVSDHTGYIKSLALTEIRPKNEFFDYESKYSGLSAEITPAEIDPNTYAQIMEETEFIYESLNLRGLARVDYIITKNGVPFLIEVNTVPGLSTESILPKQAAYLGISLSELFNASLKRCLTRA